MIREKLFLSNNDWTDTETFILCLKFIRLVACLHQSDGVEWLNFSWKQVEYWVRNNTLINLIVVSNLHDVHNNTELDESNILTFSN